MQGDGRGRRDVPADMQDNCKGVAAGCCNRAVEGLVEILQECNLIQELPKAQIWCEEVGATQVADIIEFGQEQPFVAALDLKNRFHRVRPFMPDPANQIKLESSDFINSFWKSFQIQALEYVVIY